MKRAGVCADGEREADTEADIAEAESRLRTQEITGISNKGSDGLGLRSRKYFSKQEKKEKENGGYHSEGNGRGKENSENDRP